MDGLTFAQLDALEAERKAKIRDCTARLSRLLSKEFSFEELRLIQYGAGAVISPVIIEAFEIARNTTRER